jgi:hypothetical protein
MVCVEAVAPSGSGPLQAKPGRTGSETRTESQPGQGRRQPQAITISPEEAKLTDEQWASVRPLLASQKGQVGTTPHDHREVLGGMLWVARSGSSWREMPEEFGNWERAYRRHELWVKQGLWGRVLRALGEEDPPGPATKESK